MGVFLFEQLLWDVKCPRLAQADWQMASNQVSCLDADAEQNTREKELSFPDMPADLDSIRLITPAEMFDHARLSFKIPNPCKAECTGLVWFVQACSL